MNKELVSLFHKQIQHELSASQAYLGLSAWFDAQVLKGFAGYFRQQSEEERAHALKLIDFLQDRGAAVKIGALEAPKTEFSSVLEAAKHAQASERANTASIKALYEAAVRDGDAAAQVHLHWFINEQVEEEKWSAELVAMVEKIGSSVGSLYMLDHRVGKQVEKP